MTLRETVKKYKKDPKFWIVFYALISSWLLYWYPPHQVSLFEINNSTTIATLQNEYRATLTQILGGGAVVIGIYFAWGNLKVAQEGQITERFTRAVDQLGAIDKFGNSAIEIRLGGICALERIANESNKDCLPILRILTAYIRVNSYANKELKHGEIGEDIQAILTIIGKQKYSFNSEEFTPNLCDTRLCGAYLKGAHLEGAHLEGVHLEGAHLEEVYLDGAHLKGAYLKGAHLDGAHLKKAHLKGAYLKGAYLKGAHLEGACLIQTHLEGANIEGAYLEEAHLNEAHLEKAELGGAHLGGAYLAQAHLQGAYLTMTHLEGAYLLQAHLEGADLLQTHLKGAKDLSINQLLTAKTLYGTEFDEWLHRSLKKEHFEKYQTLRNSYNA